MKWKFRSYLSPFLSISNPMTLAWPQGLRALIELYQFMFWMDWIFLPTLEAQGTYFYPNLPFTCHGLLGDSLNIWDPDSLSVQWVNDLLPTTQLWGWNVICKGLYTCKWSFLLLWLVFQNVSLILPVMGLWDWLAHWNTGKGMWEYWRVGRVTEWSWDTWGSKECDCVNK